MRNKDRQTISCSELGLVAKCAQAYAFKVKNTKQSANAEKRMRVGNKEHNQFNHKVKQQSKKASPRLAASVKFIFILLALFIFLYSIN